MTKQQQLLQVALRDIQQDLVGYTQLHDLMLQLNQQLLVRNGQQIDRLNGQILALVEQGRLRAGRRSKLLAAFRLNSAVQGVKALLAQLPVSQREQAQLCWQQLCDLSRDCKQLNERNGQLLAMQNEILEHLLRPDSGSDVYVPQHY